MTKLEAIRDTREHWEKLNPKHRANYSFSTKICLLCRKCNERCCNCVWYKAYGVKGFETYKCIEWITSFRFAGSIKEASFAKDTIIGMLLCLEEEYKGK